MLPIETIAQFFATALFLALAPGPDNIFVLTQSALYGSRAGLVTTLGLASGLLVHSTAVALGVAVIFQNSALAFTLLKLAGAGYLLYLAWLSWRAGSVRMVTEGQQFIGYAALYRRGIIMNITNPKVTLFFLAFLPQFTQPALGNVAGQIGQLGGLFILATLLIFGLVALLGGRLAQVFNASPRGQRIMNRIASCIFLALAVVLVFSGHV
ncbi:MAG: LysE family translocator [Desulfovibrionaceae bacterium]|nr:LysE family translocator [Desulfovibrionaceae bacterium]